MRGREERTCSIWSIIVREWRLRRNSKFLGLNVSKTEHIRNIELEITKKVQQKTHLEEDLDVILAEADLEQYKKIGFVL